MTASTLIIENKLPEIRDNSSEASMSPDSKPEPPLPSIRDDLELLPGPPSENGTPSWTLHDRVRNRFYRIGQLEFEIIARWHLKDVTAIVSEINGDTAFEVSAEDVLDFKKFLLLNFLLDPACPETLNRLRAVSRQKKPGIIKWLIHHYLFIRIPLVHPDPFLSRTLPIFRIFISRPFFYLLGVIFLLGTFMVMRQWESFIHTFQYFFSLKGMIFYAMAIFFAKLVHELGHAYTSKYYGLEVPAMGIAFLVLWPILYTDCSDSWKLKSRFSRMKIVAAGTVAEAGLAVIATFLWSFVPDGIIRSACFIVATTTWVSSLLLNLSPFMRFDGYYMLSDLLDVPNLQERAFALGRYYLRKVLFGLDIGKGESFSPAKEKKLVLYAYSTWIYRLILFTLIALVVYHLFFKALGIFLFFVEIIMFIFRPVYMEILKWKDYRTMIKPNRNILITGFILLVLLSALIIPWNSRIDVPAVLKANAHRKIFSPFEAQIRDVNIKDGQEVREGDIIFGLHSDRLDHDIELAEAKIKVLKVQLKRQGTRSVLLEQNRIMERQLASAIAEFHGLEQQRSRLDIRAPHDGIIVDLKETVKPGLWVNRKQPLTGLKSGKGAVLEAYINEEILSRIKPGNSGIFYMNNRSHNPAGFSVSNIDTAGTGTLEEPGLASIYGGSIPVKKGNGGELISHKSLYRIILEPDLKMDVPEQKVYGTVRVKGERISFIKRVWIRIHAILIRESGF